MMMKIAGCCGNYLAQRTNRSTSQRNNKKRGRRSSLQSPPRIAIKGILVSILRLLVAQKSRVESRQSTAASNIYTVTAAPLQQTAHQRRPCSAERLQNRVHSSCRRPRQSRAPNRVARTIVWMTGRCSARELHECEAVWLGREREQKRDQSCVRRKDARKIPVFSQQPMVSEKKPPCDCA